MDHVSVLRTHPAQRPEDVPSLVDPRFDHDSCGVGFVATIAPGATGSTILPKALTALARLAHRGATAADGKSSDGVGVMTAVPRALYLREAKLELTPDEMLGVGVLFSRAGSERSAGLLEAAVQGQGMRVLSWRRTPVRTECLGEIALGTMPEIRQVFLTDTREDTPENRDRRLYLARKSFERALAAAGEPAYLCSLSCRTVVYKAMCTGALLPEFFPDLADPAYETPFAIFHQRYATNTLPAWHRAQPGRLLAHNGEINTIWGNRARMRARESSLPEECKPLLTEGGTDSTSLDEAVELIARNGRSLGEAMRMLLPPAAMGRNSPFLRYHMDSAEPWDGPAALAFSDGRYVGAALDRNGLRPCRFSFTSEGLVVAGSEVGLVDLDPETVVHSGRLGPGQMLLVDLEEKRVYEDRELWEIFDADTAYTRLLEEVTLEPAAETRTLDPLQLEAAQRRFGYTREDVKMILQPMALDGKDAVWSMGDDTALAFFARAPRPLYGYFRQRFAQVTNPAIDPLRESCVISLHTRLGPWSHLLDKNAPLPGLSMASPLLSLGQVQALRAGAHPHREELPVAELACTFPAGSTLLEGLDTLCAQACETVKNGTAILLLSDRSAHADNLPIPMAMATGAVHQALVEAGLRTRTGLAVEAGDCRDTHHAAVLIGYGAGVVCPWLALETARSFARPGEDPGAAEARMLKSFGAGLAKIMSKMGISVVDSYRGAHLFDSLGLHASVVDRCFPGTPAPLSGIGFAEIEAALRAVQAGASQTEPPTADLPDYGWVRFRKTQNAELHLWQPPSVKALQTVVGSARGMSASGDSRGAFSSYSHDVLEREPSMLRDLLEIRPAGPELSLAEVETPASLCRHFVSSAMSLGSLSPEAHQTITAAMNLLGTRSNTGEGGEDRAVYRVMPEKVAVKVGMPQNPAATSSVALAEAPPAVAPELDYNNKIKQIASGRFGVTAEYLAHAEEIEIKVAQGAKPGEGGQLPGFKVSGLIARLRHAQPGVSLISPPPHHDIYSIEDLAQLIYDLKRVNPRAAVGVKLVASCGVGTVAAGVAKAYADFIVIAGNTGGTGAAALSSIKYAGSPWELGLAEAQQVLMANGMRERVKLRTDGGLSTARDVLIAALLGADEFAFGTAVLVAIGCDMARQCHLNTCPTGIATQKPELRAKFRGKPEHIVRLFEELSSELQQLLARYGLRSLADATGRTDLLEQVRSEGHLDLRSMLARVGSGPVRWGGGRNNQPVATPPIDEAWVEPALQAVRSGAPYRVEATIANRDRSVGARLAGEIALLRAQEEELPVNITLELRGVAGQSFGAFTVEGMRLILDGLANDFVGKGLSGGEIIVRPLGLAARQSEQHVILGNVALYGATAGRLLAAGRAGERFAVRNSGATAVVEGIGDHGCEYMTGGTVVVLGSVGVNFGAGMTGGTAWVRDADGSFLRQSRFHTDFLTGTPHAETSAEAQQALHDLLEQHRGETCSSLAGDLLAHWSDQARTFVLLTPKPQA